MIHAYNKLFFFYYTFILSKLVFPEVKYLIMFCFLKN